MGLRNLAAADLKVILNDSVQGFGWDIVVTSPNQVVASFVGYSNDVSEMVDFETGGIISGRTCTATLSMVDLINAFPGEGLPIGIANSLRKPWLVSFDDVFDTPYTFKVIESNPDRSIGIVRLMLGSWQ